MHHKFIDQYADLNSLLHRVDPRVKLIAFSGLILFVLLTPLDRWGVFLSYGLLLISLLKSSGIPLRFFLLRFLLVFPFIAVIVLPTFFLKGGGGPSAYGSVVGRGGGDGSLVFLSVLTKSSLSVLSMTLLFATTPFTRLLKGLERMACPSVFVMIFSFMYRYIYLLIDEFMRMNQARLARTTQDTRRPALKTFANIAGNLFVKSYEKGEAIYMAMASRGYDGSIRTMNRLAIKRFDYFFLGLFFFYLVIVRSFF